MSEADRALLAALFETEPPAGIVCAVGAGGKKTALHRIAEAFARAYPKARMGLTATVFGALPPRRLLDLRLVEADPTPGATAPGAERRIGYFTPSSKPGRLGPVTPEAVARIHQDGGYALTLVKADGARMRGLKAPEGDEPVIPVGTGLVLHLSSAAALGQTLDAATVHRPDRFCALTGAVAGATIAPEHVARLLAHPEGAGHRTGAARLVPIINQVEGPERVALARATAEQALALTDRFDRVVLTSLRADPPIVAIVRRKT